MGTTPAPLAEGLSLHPSFQTYQHWQVQSIHFLIIITIVFLGTPPDGSSMSPQQNWEHFSKGQLLILEETQDFQNSALLSLNHRTQTELAADIKIWVFSAL